MKQTQWTKFHDMYSAGQKKEKYSKIYIEAPREEAISVFYNRFGHNPERVTCPCCGFDYSIDTYDSLVDATAFDRGCDYDISAKKYIEDSGHFSFYIPYKTLEEYIREENILVIYAKDILSHEKEGEVPDQGYVWVE